MSNPYKNLKEPTADVGSEDLAAALLLLAKSHSRLATATERIADLLDKATIEEQGSGSSLIRLLVDRG